jgi:hypothetical protein
MRGFHDYLNNKFHQDNADNLQMDKAAHISFCLLSDWKSFSILKVGAG